MSTNRITMTVKTRRQALKNDDCLAAKKGLEP